MEPSETEEAMAYARPGESPGAKLARARVLGAMFGHDNSVGTFGRFRVLDRLGAGAMGVVYEAYDPDLARGVALKLVNVATSDREVAFAEAKALARLSHPNVVSIFEVGLDGDHVYIVMELVRGETLRKWSEGRKLLEILEMYRQAGEGLAAAHAVELVHRDFKPENAIVGRDGRVRVVDFGLACEAEDPARAASGPRHAAGTPRFMAPEVKAGRPVTPAADQYGFSVALAEALDLGGAPIPRRIAAVLERGRASDPEARFQSMADLLRALARDPARQWRRVAAIGALAAVVVAGAYLAGRRNTSESDELDVCENGSAELAAAFDPETRQRALDRIAALGPYGASLRRPLEDTLNAHAARWASQYRSACRDRLRRKESDSLSDRRTACLKRSSDALAAVGELIGRAQPANLAELPRAAQSIPDPASCSDLRALVSEIARPPLHLAAAVREARSQLTRARVHIGAGRYPEARTEAQSVMDFARRVGYPPLLAEALLLAGHAWMMQDLRSALPILVEATTTAMAARMDAEAVEAWARRAYAQGTSDDPAGALGGLDVIEPLAERTPSAIFARALMYNNIGNVQLARGRRDKASEAFQRALAVSRDIMDPLPIELVVIRANLALVTDDRTQGDRYHLETIDALTARLGADHPDTLSVRWNRGTVTMEDLGEALEYLTRVCTAYQLHPASSKATAECWLEVGMLRWDLGRRAEALDAMERAAAEIPEAAAYAVLLRRDPRAAAVRFTDLVAAMPARPDEPWWGRRERGRLLLGLGRAYRELENLDGARKALEPAVSDLEVAVRNSPMIFQERLLGRAHVDLALTLAAMRADPSTTRAVATEAAAWSRRVHGAELAPLERLSGRVP